ncbi:MAG TPA: hypothetical protein VK466_10085, partial [Terriglobales bacterium]|nr:hypothetical protein [Terriglobales bacterium]
SVVLPWEGDHEIAVCKHGQVGSAWVYTQTPPYWVLGNFQIVTTVGEVLTCSTAKREHTTTTYAALTADCNSSQLNVE